MNMKIFATMSILLLVGLVGADGVCTKHATDGSLGDWGLNALKDNTTWGLNSTWLPNAGVQFIVKDDYNPKAGAGWEPGVHIRGTGSSYVFYDDPQVIDKNGNPSWEPYGGLEYNIQALYLDQDSNCLYTTIITSVDPNGLGDAAPADFAMNLDQNINTGMWGYEWGVKLEHYHAPMTLFGLYSNPDWQQPPYVPLNRPSYFKNGTYIDQVDGVYTELKDGNGNAVYDDGYPVYIVQLAIPRSMVGDTNVTDINDLHITSFCGNDHIPAPEFPFILVPLAITAIAPLLGYYISRKQN
jgi:hypothetical protein